MQNQQQKQEIKPTIFSRIKNIPINIYQRFKKVLEDIKNIVTQKSDKNENANNEATAKALMNKSYYMLIGYILFFIIYITVLIILYNYDILNNSYFAYFIFPTIIIGVFFTTMILWSLHSIRQNQYFLHKPNEIPKSTTHSQENDHPFKYFKNLLILFCGFTFIGIILIILFYCIEKLSNHVTSTSVVINVTIIVLICFIVYKVISIGMKGNKDIEKKSQMISSSIFSRIKSFIENVIKFFVKDYNETSSTSVLILLITILIFIIYFIFPYLMTSLQVQGGKQYINKPIYTDKLTNLASYEELNGGNDFEYDYAISFWMFIDSFPVSTNSSYTKYVPILDYGRKPCVYYNASLNTLMVTMNQKGLEGTPDNSLEFDENGDRIIFRKKNVLLQKWNNIIINYNKGTLDIFYNGDLVKSVTKVVPYMTFDTLSVGSDQGVKCGICNVIYFKHSLQITNIYYLYNNLKEKNPPSV